jgi:hypothetical protein
VKQALGALWRCVPHRKVNAAARRV